MDRAAKARAEYEKLSGEKWEVLEKRQADIRQRQEAEMEARLRRAAQEHGRVDFPHLQIISREDVFSGYGAIEVAEKYRALGLPYDSASQKLYEDGLRRAPIDNLIVAIIIIWCIANYLMLVLAVILPYERVPLFEFSFYWLETAVGALLPGGIITGWVVLFVYAFIALAVVLPAMTKSITGYIFAVGISVLASFLPSVVYDWSSRAMLSSPPSSGVCAELGLNGPRLDGSCF